MDRLGVTQEVHIPTDTGNQRHSQRSLRQSTPSPVH